MPPHSRTAGGGSQTALGPGVKVAPRVFPRWAVLARRINSNASTETRGGTFPATRRSSASASDGARTSRATLLVSPNLERTLRPAHRIRKQSGRRRHALMRVWLASMAKASSARARLTRQRPGFLVGTVYQSRAVQVQGQGSAHRARREWSAPTTRAYTTKNV